MTTQHDTGQAHCPACGGPPVGSAGHSDSACPLTRTPGLIRRGGSAPRPKRSDLGVPLDEGDPWDTDAVPFDAHGWPKP